MVVGTLCSLGTGALQPLNMLIFGNLTGDIVAFALITGSTGIVTAEELEAAQQRFMDAITNFAIYNSLIGVGMFILSYISILLFNWSGLRQVIVEGIAVKLELN